MNKIFSKDIYKQTIKKLGLIAILTALISIMVTLIMINTNFYLGGRYMILDIQFNYFMLYGSNGFTAAGLAPFLIIVMFVGSILFTYMTFSYQNKRALSDKYHSLPYTRTQQYVSRILAVLTLLYAVVILTMLVSYINLKVAGLLFIPKYYILSTLGYIAGTTLISAITAAAMSITGNVFANMTVTGILLFLPRCILFFISIQISRISNQMISINDLNVLLSPSTNIPVGIVLDISRLWTYNGTSETLISTRGIIFTFILAIVYLLIALFLSNKRKSELAGKSFMHPIVSYVFASLCALPLIAYNAYGYTGQRIMYHENLVQSLKYSSPALIIFAVILFIVLTVIYNTKTKGLVKGLIVFTVISLLGYGITAGGVAIANGLTHKEINNDKVEYVTIDLSWEKKYVNTPVYTYGVMMAKDVKIYDEALIDILTEQYQKAEQQIADNPEAVYRQYNRSKTFWCEFHMINGNTIVRNIPVYDSNISDGIIELLLANDEFYTALYSLPDAEDVSNIYCTGNSTQIYEMYLNELKSTGVKSYEALPSNLTDNFYVYNYLNSGTVNYITIRGMYNGDAYSTNLPLSNFVPKTKRLYMQQTALANYDELMESFDIIIDSRDQQKQLFVKFKFDNYIEAQAYNNTLNFYNENVNETFDYDELIKLIEDLKTVDVNSFDSNDYYVLIDYRIYTENDLRYSSTFLPMDKEMYSYWMEQAANYQ